MADVTSGLVSHSYFVAIIKAEFIVAFTLFIYLFILVLVHIHCLLEKHSVLGKLLRSS